MPIPRWVVCTDIYSKKAEDEIAHLVEGTGVIRAWPSLCAEKQPSSREYWECAPKKTVICQKCKKFRVSLRRKEK